MNTITQKLRPLSYRQMRAIQFWLNGGRKNKAEALRRASYGKSLVRQPHKVFNSPAVQRELAMRGFGPFGILNNQKPPEPLKIVSRQPTPKIDFSKVTKEQWQDLKYKLANIPEVVV